MAIDRTSLERDIAAMKAAASSVVWPLILEAAEAHLASLPNPKDHVIVCRHKSTGRVELFSYEGESLMTAEDAAERVKNWTRNYSETTYVSVKIPT
jgi:hypothetical protein